MIVDKIETKNNSIVCGKDDEFDRALDSKQIGFVFLCIFLVILSMIGCSVMADIIGYKGNSE